MQNNFLSLSAQNPLDNVQVRKVYNLTHLGQVIPVTIGVDSITNQVGLLQERYTSFEVAQNDLDRIYYYELLPFNVKETAFDMGQDLEVTIIPSNERLIHDFYYKGNHMRKVNLYFYLPEIDFYAICSYEIGATSSMNGDEEVGFIEEFQQYEYFNIVELVEKIN